MRIGSEKWAAALCVVLVGAGIWLGWHNPAWLGRFGALVIIVGILLGFSRLPDVVQIRWDALRMTAPEVAESAMAQVEKERGKTLSDEERAAAIKKVEAEAKKHMDEIVEAWKKQFRRYELVMLVGGTFINGFGEYIMKVAKTLQLDN